LKIKVDCRFFKGDRPCHFHKEEGLHCDGCPYYQKVASRILIIKLGAIGDVIRTTPILHKLKELYPQAEITWITYSPEVVPSIVDHALNFELKNILYLRSIKFDLLYNLDKDLEACALANQISADVKRGLKLELGHCAPRDKDSEDKWLTGLFDDINRANQKSYPQEIFEICGFQFKGEKYILEVGQEKWDIPENHPLIGLNTGCGERWNTRLWSIENWIELAQALKKEGFGVLLLGGESENEKNRIIAKESGATYAGHFPLKKFFTLMDQCDLIVTAVSMALHIAIALEKKVVLFNNIFNRNEFELYGLGEIIEPEVECLGCFRGKCPQHCMELIKPHHVVDTCQRLLDRSLAKRELLP
jgi:heptosyltransferase-2